MGFIRIGVKVITSFCKCPNIRTTLDIIQCSAICSDYKCRVAENLFTII